MKVIRVGYLVYLIIISLYLVAPTRQTSAEMDRVNLFFADRQMMRLIQTDYYVSSGNAETQAEMIIKALISGKDDNESVRRLIPAHDDALSVSVRKDVAYVNVNMKYIEEYEVGKQLEELVVYQIVNSLSSVSGINAVRFVFDGKSMKKFLWEIDMRDVFVPDYFV